jgi:prephenate dehydrogenase
MPRSIAVIGTGLIGTSVALAARSQGVRVHLADRDPAAVREAVGLGAGVGRRPSVPADLAVLAVPPSEVASVLAEEQDRGLARSYTDVASIKRGPERQVLTGAMDARSFVGGHPLAGRERSGPGAARSTLFQGRPWVLTPSQATGTGALRRARRLAALCGAVPVVMTSAAHDQAMALVSHAPHAVATLLAARLRHCSPQTASLAGSGLRDVVRIAGGGPRLWSDILGGNADEVTRVLIGLQQDLALLIAALERLAEAGPSGDQSGRKILEDLLEEGRACLAELPTSDPAPQAGPA